MSEDSNEDDDDINVELVTKNNDKSQTKPKEAYKNVQEADNSKKAGTEKIQKDIQVDKDDEEEKADKKAEDKKAEDKKAEDKKAEDKNEEANQDSELKDDDEKSSEDSGKLTRNNEYILRLSRTKSEYARVLSAHTLFLDTYVHTLISSLSSVLFSDP
jgi:hypothetical protein